MHPSLQRKIHRKKSFFLNTKIWKQKLNKLEFNRLLELFKKISYNFFNYPPLLVQQELAWGESGLHVFIFLRYCPVCGVSSEVSTVVVFVHC